MVRRRGSKKFICPVCGQTYYGFRRREHCKVELELPAIFMDEVQRFDHQEFVLVYVPSEGRNVCRPENCFVYGTSRGKNSNGFKKVDREFRTAIKNGPAALPDPDIKATRDVDDSMIPDSFSYFEKKEKKDVVDLYVPIWKHVPYFELFSRWVLPKFVEDELIVVPSKKKKLSEAPVNDLWISEEDWSDFKGFDIDLIVDVEVMGKAAAARRKWKHSKKIGWGMKLVNEAYPVKPRGPAKPKVQKPEEFVIIEIIDEDTGDVTFERVIPDDPKTKSKHRIMGAKPACTKPGAWDKYFKLEDEPAFTSLVPFDLSDYQIPIDLEVERDEVSWMGRWTWRTRYHQDSIMRVFFEQSEVRRKYLELLEELSSSA